MKTQKIKFTSITTAILASFLVLGIVGCSDQNKKQIVSRINNDKSVANVTEPGNSSYVSGQFKGAIVNTGSSSNFQRAVEDVVSSFVADIRDFGTVSGDPNKETGVRFNGSATFVDSDFDPTLSYNKSFDKNDSSFTLFIRDSQAIDSEYSGFQIKGFALTAGSIRNNRVSIRFENSLLVIELEGAYNKNHFYGDAYYTNKLNTSKDGRLGSFNIKVCDFFSC